MARHSGHGNVTGSNVPGSSVQGSGSRFWFEVLVRGSRLTFSPEEPGTTTLNLGTWYPEPWYTRPLDKECFVVLGPPACGLAALEPADGGHHRAETHHERVSFAQ